ncbi:anterior gradient protein 3-like [Synchiropus splendidus]|uniref:anterior gradient protein 3-like n=1 Tax=Synchiropus splendidus TaxID=270530 RepID=UPI00237EBC6E|nr:anterior gradient protein 3-like [Synchiropus splendidus]
MYRLVLLVVLLVISANADEEADKEGTASLAKGWGNAITWEKTYGEALRKMVESKKPLMVIHHLEECEHSKALKKVFADDSTIQKMAKDDFIMLNIVEETTDKNMAPDGYYVPRILFVDPSLTVRTDIMGRYSNAHYVYEPLDLKLLAENMKKAKLLIHEEL